MKENNISEVIKVLYSPSSIGLLLYANYRPKVIYIILKVEFDLDSISKLKSVVGPDNLLLLLVYY
jgi:hypothetical protein